MKRALVLGLVVVLGLGVGAFAQLSGSWASTLSFNLGATDFKYYIVDLTSTFEIDYAIAGWTFGSTSDFDLTGFAAQSFSVEGTLGAFTFESSAAFAPMLVTEYTYPDLGGTVGAPLTQTPSATLALCDKLVVVSAGGPAFLTLDATGSVTIAGVKASVYVFMDQSNVIVHNIDYATTLVGVQTDSWVLPSFNNGTGAKITIAGSIGSLDITSYTYFNLTEYDKRSTFCPEVGKRGVFHVLGGCYVWFNEEYVMFEGLTFGCVEFDAALKIYCTGFSSFKLVANNIDIGGWATLNVGILFGVDWKGLDLCLTLNKLAFDCITVELGFGNTGYVTGPLSIDKINIHGFGVTTEVGAVTFSSFTELDPYSQLISTDVPAYGIYDYKYLDGDASVAFLVPFAGITSLVPGTYEYCQDGGLYGGDPEKIGYLPEALDYYELACVPEYRYLLWEMFQISIDEDACCGGLFGVDIVTYFGDLQKLSWFAYDIVDATDGTVGDPVFLLGIDDGTFVPQDPAYPEDATADPLCWDSVVYQAGYDFVDGATQLFNWAYTTVEFSVGMGSNLTLNLGAGISAFGWEDLSLGFEFTW